MALLALGVGMATAEELILKVSATQELLERQLREMARNVETFEQAAEVKIEQLEKRFSGINFGGAVDSLRSVDKEFKARFDQIGRYAEEMARAVTSGGATDFSPILDQARARAAQLQQQANITRVLAAAEAHRLGGVERLSTVESAGLAATRAAAEASARKAAAAQQEVSRLEELQAAMVRATGAQEQMVARQNRAIVSTGQLRAGTQQLSYQIGDVAQQFALGVNPMVIFAQQGGQVVQAISLMQGESKGLMAFLGGPWGAAIMGAVTVLGLLGAKYLESGEAAKKAEAGASGLSEAQGALAAVFDLTTGRIKTQNELLLANARLMQINLRSRSIEASRKVDKALSDADSFTLFGARPSQFRRTANTSTAQRDLLSRVRSGELSADQAILRADSLPDSGLKLSRTDLIQAIIAEVEARDSKRVADEIGKSLDTGVLKGTLAEGLIKPDKPRRGPSAESVRQRELSEDISYTEMERSARRKLIDAMGKTTASEEQRAALLREDIDIEANAQARKIDLLQAKGRLSQAEADNLRTLNEQLRQQKLQNVEVARRSDQLRQEAVMQGRSLEEQIAMLRIQGDLTDTAKERKRIALEILRREQELARRVLQLIIADPKSTESEVAQAARDLDALQARQGAEREAVSRQNETPAEQYLRSLRRTPEQINEAIDEIKIRGLDALNDGIVDAILNARSLGDVFKSVANQIIADLLRIAVQRAVIGPLADFLFGGAGLFGGGGGSVYGGNLGGIYADGGRIPGFARGGMFQGPGGPRSDNLIARVSPGEFIINAESTRRFLPLIQAINDNKVPRFAKGGIVGDIRVPTISSRMLSAVSDQRTQPLVVKVEASPYFDAHVERGAAKVAAPMAAQAAMAGSALAQAQAQRRTRNRIPG